MTIKGIHFQYCLIFYVMIYFAIIIGSVLAFKTYYQVYYIVLDMRLEKGAYLRSSNLPVEVYKQFRYSGKYKTVRFFGTEKILIKIV